MVKKNGECTNIQDNQNFVVMIIINIIYIKKFV